MESNHPSGGLLRPAGFEDRGRSGARRALQRGIARERAADTSGLPPDGSGQGDPPLDREAPHGGRSSGCGALRTRARGHLRAPKRSGPTSAARGRTHLPRRARCLPRHQDGAGSGGSRTTAGARGSRTFAHDLEPSSLVIEMEGEFGREPSRPNVKCARQTRQRSRESISAHGLPCP